MIRQITTQNFPPFGKFELDLKPVEKKPEELGEVHLFTGVNGTGKTRILSLIAAMLGNPTHLLKRLQGFDSTSTISVRDSIPAPGSSSPISILHAGSGGISWTQNQGNIINALAHTPAFAYSGNAYVSDQQVAVLANVQMPDRHGCLSFNRLDDSSKVLLQAITNLKIASALDTDSPATPPNGPSNPTRLVKALEATITHITGTTFAFQIIRFPTFSLAVNWGDKRLPFNVLPDGLRSLIGWLVHSLVMLEINLQGKRDAMQTEVFFLLDEIESHLHPAWQRKILPAFQRLFPKAQIFVATHSPFVIASLNHGWIHPISLRSDGTAKFDDQISASSGDSYVTVVEEIMGVKDWFDPETESLLAKFREARDQAYLASESDRRRASATINLYRLNERHPVFRKSWSQRRLKLRDEHLDTFPYRSYIEGAVPVSSAD